MTSVVVLLVLASACERPLSNQQGQEIAGLLDAAEARVSQVELARRQGIAAWWAQPATIGQVCPTGVVRDVDSPRGAVDNLSIVDRADFALEDAPRVVAMGDAIESMRRRLDPTQDNVFPAESYDWARERAVTIDATDEWPFEITFIVERRVAPQMTEEAMFSPGSLEGEAVVWSYATSTVVCSLPLSVTNDNTVGVSNASDEITNERTLNMDLEMQAHRELIRLLAPPE